MGRACWPHVQHEPLHPARLLQVPRPAREPPRRSHASHRARQKACGAPGELLSQYPEPTRFQARSWLTPFSPSRSPTPPAGLLAPSRDQDSGRLRGRGGAEHLLSEELAGATAVLGRYDGGEVATANVADELLGCGIDPPDDSPSRRGRSSGRRRSPRPSRHLPRLPGRWPSAKCG